MKSPNASIWCPCRCCDVVKLVEEFPWLEITHDEWAGSPPLMPNEDEVGGEDVVIRDEDVEKVRVAPSPQLPSAEEVEEHRLTHYPFRSWCRECIEGRALGERRGQGDHGLRGKLIPTIGIDYFFITT